MSVLCAAMVLPLASLAGTSPAGQWVGEVKTPDGDKVEVFLTLSKSESVWQGTLEDPTIGETKVSNLKVTDTRISFTFQPTDSAIPRHFSGSYVAAVDRVSGTFSLHGSSRYVKFKRVPGTDIIAVSSTGEAQEPARIRHDYNFAATARFSYWVALHVPKDDYYNLNDMTASEPNFDIAFKWFVLDDFNVFVRGFRGGFGYTDIESRLAQYPDLNVTADSYLKLDGVELGVMGYLGNIMMRDSSFNPYLTGVIGQTSWALQENGRGSDTVVDGLYAFEGNDISVGFGIGTEYELNSSMVLEFEWMWRYFLTEDELKWDVDETWSNTHAWNLSVGLTYGF